MDEFKPLQPMKSPRHAPKKGYLGERPLKRLTPKSPLLKQIERLQKLEAKSAKKSGEVEEVKAPPVVLEADFETSDRPKLRIIR